MTAEQQRVSSWHGEAAYEIAGPRLTATVLPGRGGRIASLRDGSGVEWLTQPTLPLRPVAEPTDRFADGDLCGWDECAPTIDACTVDGVRMPDHGDLWRRSWQPDTDDAWWTVTSDHYRLRRRIVPEAAGLRLDYEASTTRVRLPFLWAAHPQFAAPPGSSVSLPAQVADLIDGLQRDLRRQPLAPDLLGIDQLPAGGCRKLFVDPDVRVDRCSLRRPDGAELTLTWDSSVVPYLGLWFDQSAYAREPVIALEPMTGFFDDCAAALARGRVSVLRRGETLRWSLGVSVDHVP